MTINFNKIPSPCFVLEESLLRKNLELLARVQREAGIEIICALKGYSMWSTFPMIKHYLSGATASSLNEARLIYEEMGVESHTYSPVFIEVEMEDVLRYSSHISFNSMSQYEKYHRMVKSYHKPVSIGIRVNPEYSEVGTDLYNPAMPGSRLGVIRSQLPDTLPPDIDGIHFHVLCENDSYVLERTLAKFEEKFAGLIRQAKWLNMGGGHLITQDGYDVQHLIDLLRDFRSRYPNLQSLILEPGGAIGWQTGYLVSTVLDIIENHGIRVAMLDVSFSAHMPDCLEMPYKPVILGAMDAQPGAPVYRMGGSTCLAGDFMGMGDYYFPHGLKVGDKVVFDNMIHYTMVKTTFFNGVKHPAIGIWKEDGTFVQCKAFEYSDFKGKLS